jgi:hypothetical protein
MDWCISPDNYINFGYYSLVTSALQRRVWSGPLHSPLFPNIYNILVGEPGIGKGLVVKEVSKLLRHHKLADPRERVANTNLSDKDKQEAEKHLKEEYKEIQENENAVSHKQKWFEKPLLIPVAADATTYEALVLEMSRSKRMIEYADTDEKTLQPKLGIYTHSSLCFCLEEISSLFRKKTEDLVRFLLQAYDCGDYNYETISRGKNRVRSCCLNIFGGTTPGFMQEALDDAIIAEGFSSRTFFIFATSNRKTALRFPELNAMQKDFRVDILQHIENLTKLYGSVSYTDESWEFLENWWKNAQKERPNTSSKLNSYYSRKNIHIQKIAMAIHFGESLEMKIELPTFQKALEVLAKEEKNMHLCLGMDKSNPLALAAKKVERYITHNGAKYTFKDLVAEFWDALPSRDPKEDMSVILEHLLFMGSISSEMGKSRIGEEVQFYFRKRESVI